MTTQTNNTSSSQIKKSYLMWVGAEHYPTIQDYVDECKTMGVSKRLPNVVVAEAMMKPGTVVFMAHDEGEYDECAECVGTIECPDCRKRNAEMARIILENDDLLEELEELKKELVSIDADLGLPRMAKNAKLKAELEEKAKKTATAIKRAQTKLRKREEKLIQLEAVNDTCDTCDGTSKVDAGTGGMVQFGDGDRWDYRKYNYYLHQPKAWSASMKDGVDDDEMCAHCGGTGRMPQGKVFGCFVPADIEYILKAEDTATVKAELEAKNVTVVTSVTAEPKRGCGVRKEGGVYVVTRTGKATKDAKKVVTELVKSGVIKAEAAQVTGNFIEFLAPVDIDSKRFRGIKTWSLEPDAEEEAEMALDALE